MVIDKIEGYLKKILETLDLPDLKFTLEHPSEEDYGDYATNLALNIKAQKLAPEKYKNPVEIAKLIMAELQRDKELCRLVSKIEIAGPGFINFWLNEAYLIAELKIIIKKADQYGSSSFGEGKKWLVEHTSPNPNKAMHLGQLRNNTTGMAIANIWEFIGINLVRDAVDNNRGIAIAKLMWGYLKFAHKKGKKITDINYWYNHQEEWQKPKDLGLRPDRFVDDLYVKGSNDFKKDKTIEDRVKKLVVDWEAEDKKTWALWKKVLEFSYQGQTMTLKRLGNRWDEIWHEHEHYKTGKEIVMKGLEKGLFRKDRNGVILSNLIKYKLPDTVLIKSDGTSLYITQDIALTKLKKEKYKPDKLFWVIGPEQTLAMKQLFAICEQLGIGRYEDYTHLAYGYMSIKGKGKMGSRFGNVVYIDDLIDDAKKEILNKIDKERFRSDQLDDLLEKIALGAIKYSILRIGRMTDTAFDFKESLNFEGNSGPYLQYTYARCRSVVRKSQSASLKVLDLNKEEISILRTIYKFPEVILEAGKNYSPNLVCNFLFDLAQKYNAFYNKHKIIGSDNEKLRVSLTAACAQVLKNGLRLLGIEVLEEM